MSCSDLHNLSDVWFVYLCVCFSCSTASLFIWQFYMCIAESSQVKVSNTSIHIAQCFTLLVCLCLCRTECPLNVLSGLPDRLLLCVILFLPSVEVKKKNSPDLAWGPLFDSGAQILRHTDDENRANSSPVFRYVCIFLCGKTLRLHLPGNSWSQLTKLHAA